MEITGKKEIRKQLLAKRMEMPKAQVIEMSREVIRRLYLLEGLANCRMMMSYLDFRNEVVTKECMEQWLASGGNVSVPYLVNEQGVLKMLASEITNLQNDLEQGTYGILSPKKDKIRNVLPGIMDVILVPGIGFDERGYRIGYGGGFYDRFLQNVRADCLKVGLAFEIQIVAGIAEEAHDIPMDVIVTNERIITAAGNAKPKEG